MPNSYIQDYMAWNSGDECPSEFHLWSGLTLLGALMGRKIWLWHGEEYFPVYANIFTALVADSNAGKGSAKSRPAKIIFDHFPQYLVSSNIQSREDIIKQMASQEGTLTWPKGDGTFGEYHPFFLIVNEMSNFFSVSDRKMVDFLVDIYDQDHFTTGFKQVESQRKMPGPYVSMLACTVPEWFMSNLKIDLYRGGLGRRLYIINRERTKVIPNPCPPQGWQEKKAKAIAHLKRVADPMTNGEVKRTREAMLYWDKIYREMRAVKASDKILDAVFQAKTNHVLKLALILSFDRYDFDFRCTDKDLFDAKALIDSIDEDVRRLTQGIGENPATGIASRILDHIRIADGMVQERRIRAIFMRDCKDERQWTEAINHLIKTEELILIGVPKDGPYEQQKKFLFTPEGFKRYEEKVKREDTS